MRDPEVAGFLDNRSAPVPGKCLMRAAAAGFAPRRSFKLFADAGFQAEPFVLHSIPATPARLPFNL